MTLQNPLSDSPLPALPRLVADSRRPPTILIMIEDAQERTRDPRVHRRLQMLALLIDTNSNGDLSKVVSEIEFGKIQSLRDIAASAWEHGIDQERVRQIITCYAEFREVKLLTQSITSDIQKKSQTTLIGYARNERVNGEKIGVALNIKTLRDLRNTYKELIKGQPEVGQILSEVLALHVAMAAYREQLRIYNPHGKVLMDHFDNFDNGHITPEELRMRLRDIPEAYNQVRRRVNNILNDITWRQTNWPDYRQTAFRS